MTSLSKKFRKHLQLIAATSLCINLLIGCDKCVFKETSTGLAYKIEKKGEGAKPKNGQILFIDVLYQTKNKVVLFNSSDQEVPITLPYNDSIYISDGGLYEAISMLAKGDSITFKIPAKKLLGDHFSALAEKHKLQEKTPLYVSMFLNNIINEEEFYQMETERYKDELEKHKQQIDEQLPKDLEMINAYLKKNNIKALSTASGLKYVIDKPGKGPTPQPGNSVQVNYVGKTLEGQVFDTNIQKVAQENNIYNAKSAYTPLEFKIGAQSVIPGFEEGIKLLKKQGKACLFVPSVLAYGASGQGEYIKPDANLIFEVELVDIVTH